MNYKNAIYNVHGGIDCQVNHPQYGWIPTTLSAEDSVTKDLFFELNNSDNVLPFSYYVFELNGSICISTNPFNIPLNIPYIKTTSLPEEPIEAWDVDFSNPDGFGEKI